MGATFVITLREGFEAALLLGIVYAYLEKTGGRRDFRWVTLGAAAGVLASVGLGAAIATLSGPLLELGPDVIGIAVIFAAVGLLTWHGWWMQRNARAIRGDVERRLDAARATRRLWPLALIAFVGVFREGAESVLFLWGLLTQMASAAGWGGLAGGVLGVAAASALGVAVYRGGRRVSVGGFFTVTSVLLLLVASGLFGTGVGRLQGLGVLPQTSVLWDTSSFLDDRGIVGSLLAGLLGYRARPTGVEAASHLVYLAAGSLLLFGDRLRHLRPGAGVVAAPDPGARAA